MTTATTGRTLEAIATTFNVLPENVAVLTGSTYRRHLVIKGSSLCGQINNDGYDLKTMFQSFQGLVCKSCDKRFVAKAGC